jgi:PAS domain S-box-containing protein
MTPSLSPGVRPRILLVMEDQSLADFLSADLTAAGFDVTAAPHAAVHEAVAAITPALSVVDGPTAPRTCASLRATPRSALRPILVVASADDGHAIDEALDSGADDVIIAPVHPRLLLSRIRHMLAVWSPRNAAESHAISKAQFERLFQNSPDGIWLLEPVAPWLIVECNARACQMHGYQREELIGQPISLLRPDTSITGFPLGPSPTLEGTEIPVAEDVHRHKSGRLVYVEYSTSLVIVDGKPVVLGIDRDITKRKEAEAALRRNEERFEFAARATNDAIWDFDLITHQGWWSRAFRVVFGHRDGFVEPETWEPHIHPDDRERVLASLEQVIGGGQQSWIQEYRFQRADGTYAFVIDRGFVVRDDHGVPVRMIGAMMDNSARKAAELALLAAKEDAEHANLAKTEFLSRMSHELRTPLTTILGYSQLLEQALADPVGRRQVSFVIKAGEYLLSLINDMLDLSRIETEHLDFQVQATTVADLLVDVADLMQQTASAQEVQLAVEPSQVNGGRAYADPRRLQQVLLNLVSNAIKYNLPGGSVTLVCEVHAECVHIGVRDTGPGILPEHMGRLFTPFDRLGAEQRGISGIGLGLVLSRQLIELMGGTLRVDSRPGEGSTFWIELPAVPDGAP